ncbi:MAG: protease pro-enzyme activation domain-containing protein [Terracidiphilus sp.]
MNHKLAVFALTLAAMVSAGTQDSRAESLLTRHVRDVVLNGQAKPIGRLPATQIMQIDIVLPLRDPVGLDAFVADVYNPSSPNYRHFLTPAETSARFGPTQESWDALVSFAKDHGLTVVGGSLAKRDLVLTGEVSNIESAFNVTMRTYQHPTENRVFYSPDREPNVNLSFHLEHISGLDNYSKPHPLLVKRSNYAAAHGISAEEAVTHATTGSGPSASFLGSDMRAAYYGGTALTGAGQTVGLFEYIGTDLADLTTYYKNIGQTEPFTPKLVSVDGTSLTCTCSSKNMTTCENGTTTTSCDDTEQTLDMTQAMGMAPGLAGLTVYVGSTDTAIISAMTTNADGPLPGTIGCSWGWTPADPSTLDGYFETMSAQGQNFFAASGDSSTWSSSNEAWPADDAHVVSVGGTDLVTASAAGPWSSETAWSDSGGGISPDSIAIPSWQAAAGVITSSNKGSTTLRNGPDVSANANFTFYTCSDQTTCLANEYGGTSFAAPMWASYIALVNQQLASNGESPIGFIDPLIYPIGLSTSYDTDFHDITSGKSGSYSAVTGFDLVTGWGSPNGVNLINALAPASTTPSFSLSATAASVTVGSTGTSTVTESVTGGYNSTVTLSASGLPSGVSALFNPTSITGAGTSTLTFTAISTATTGTYTITVTGTPASGNAETATLTLIVSAVATPSFSLSASAASVKDGSTGTSTITETVANGYNTSVTLSASGLPNGVTALFSPTSLTGAGTSTLTFTAASTAAPGTYTISVTGTPASGTAKTATLTLTVTAAVTGSFTIAVSPTSGYLDRGQSGYAIVTTTASGGFNSAITFSATGIPSGVTGSFSPSSVNGSGTTDFTLTVSRNAPTGTYPITITGAGGGLTESTVLTFEVYR